MPSSRAPLLALIAFALSAAPAGAQPAAASPSLAWRSIGPAVSGGRVAAVAGTDRDAALYYAGAAGGGVWRTTDAGQRWQPVFDATGVASIGAIAIDPNDSKTVWVGTGEANPRNDVSDGNGAYESTDGGKTWAHVLPLTDAQIGTVLIDPRDSRRVFVGVLGDVFADGTDRGVYRTTDGGASWSKVLFPGLRSGISDMAMDPSNPDVIYAGVWEVRRTGWSLQSGGDQDGLYRSTDGGTTWTKLTGNGLPDGIEGRIAVAIAPSNPKRIYALIQSAHGLLWRSDDGGATWIAASSDTIINERPYYFSHLTVDPSNPDRVWSDSVHLTVSADGGKTFETTGHGTHGDHHIMWVASGGKRIIEGNDGGVAFSHDGGATWAWNNVLPISQAYHVGYSLERPYRVCAPLQDNGTYCAPADPLQSSGVSSSQWQRVDGGDGTWAEFDPRDPHKVWAAFGGGDVGGDVYVHDFSSGDSRPVQPYPRDQNVVDPAKLAHRFNWETPIAFDPFDNRVAFVGGEALFATNDRGYTWRVVSPDLTRNVRTHQVITGGITLDGTGAETSDTILAIAPSRAARGEIWVGTDDGAIQLTRDGGRHWRDVTPQGVQPFGRFASIAPSADPARAYAIYDRHMVGDRTAYAFVTDDYGRSWRSIAAGLPSGEPARSILEDYRNPSVIYAGLERSMWVSWDGGSHWDRITGLPPVCVRDIRWQPDSNDLLIATHGRGVFVFDDATPFQDMHQARDAGTWLFPVRDATRWMLHRYWNTGIDGDAPPYGAIVTFYQASAAAHAPTAEIVDARGRIVRHFATHDEDGKRVDDLPNDAGLNRFAWDLATDPATEWSGSAQWNRGSDGIPVVPGTYTLRLHVGSKTLARSIVVGADPRSHYTPAEMETAYELQHLLLDDLSKLDEGLNGLSAMQRTNAGSPRARAARALQESVTSNPANDQDNDFLTDLLRERLQSLLGSLSGTFAPPTHAQLREAAQLHAAAMERILAIEAFEAQFGTAGRSSVP